MSERKNGTSPLLSFIMPAHNEEDVIEDTVKKCLETIEKEGLSGEVIVANDGSVDRTGEILDRLAGLHESVQVYHLKQNGGYGVAMRKALGITRGRYVVTLDSDGQFDPDDAIKLLRKAQEGHVCVTGFRGKKKYSLGDQIIDRAYP